VLVAVVVIPVLVVAQVSWSSVDAAFTAKSANSGSTFSAAALAAPSGLSATKSCMPTITNGSAPVIQYQTNLTGSGTTVGFSKPTGTTVGDLLIAHIGADNDYNITPPAGWTKTRDDYKNSSPYQESWVLYHIAGASEPGTYNITFGGSQGFTAVLLRITGVDTRSPLDTVTGIQAASSTSLTAPGLTTVANNVLLLAFFTVRAQVTVTPPAGMTELYDFQAGTTVTAEVAQQTISTAGATGNRTATASSAGLYIAQLLAVRPSAPHAAPMLANFPQWQHNSSGGAVTITQPTGITTGDLLVLGFAWAGGTGNAPTPSGWTQVRADANGTSLSSGWWYRVVTGSEPASWSISPGSSVAMVGVVYLLRNVNTSTPVSGSGVTTGTGTALTAPSVATTDSHPMVLRVFNNNDSSSGLDGPAAGTTWDDGDAATTINGGASHQIATSTSTGTASWKANNSTPWIGATLAINPAADPYTINATLFWTATSSSWATGYEWQRVNSGTVERTSSVSGQATTTASDTDALMTGTTYTYKLASTINNWRSPQITTTLAPTCP
jgi:hypothetical protein